MTIDGQIFRTVVIDSIRERPAVGCRHASVRPFFKDEDGQFWCKCQKCGTEGYVMSFCDIEGEPSIEAFVDMGRYLVTFTVPQALMDATDKAYPVDSPKP